MSASLVGSEMCIRDSVFHRLMSDIQEVQSCRHMQCPNRLRRGGGYRNVYGCVYVEGPERAHPEIRYCLEARSVSENKNRSSRNLRVVRLCCGFCLVSTPNVGMGSE
eukprot:15408630-Alexandrium_andersonii.AAC.1